MAEREDRAILDRLDRAVVNLVDAQHAIERAKNAIRIAAGMAKPGSMSPLMEAIGRINMELEEANFEEALVRFETDIRELHRATRTESEGRGQRKR